MFIPISQCEFRELLSLLTTWPEWIIDPRRFWAIAPFVSNSFVDGCRNSSRWRELRGRIFAKQFCLTQNFWQMDSQHQAIQNEKCRDASSQSRFVGFVPSRRGSVFEMPAKDLGPLHRTMEAVGFWQSLTYLDHHIAVPGRSTNINKMSFWMHHFSGFFGVWLAIFSYMWRLAMTPYVAFKKFVTMVGRSASAVPGSFGQLTRTASLKKLKACLRVILTFSTAWSEEDLSHKNSWHVFIVWYITSY